MYNLKFNPAYINLLLLFPFPTVHENIIKFRLVPVVDSQNSITQFLNWQAMDNELGQFTFVDIFPLGVSN